ncbi:MAG: bifunctional hydroxymethylpyrimidine kinase/phosphomethylpyrimidine kinase [Terriglobia bacterium]|jgi:hydroxymethylpyrimidine kinase/phosphomethylpyrimidine kinase
MDHHQTPSLPVVLTVGGFDPSSGAGITADLKTLAAHNCYGVAAITALTVQNTQGVAAVHGVDAEILRISLANLLADGNVKAIKVGMLASRAHAEVVHSILEANAALPSVLDPVIRSTSGAALLDEEGIIYLRQHLLSRVGLITPNCDEAAALTGLKVENVEGMKAAATRLAELGAHAVVITGGHLDKATDVFFDGSGFEVFAGDRIKPDNTHGTGCTFASAIAANLAHGRSLREAVVYAKAFVTEAIRKAYPIGPGRMPLNHLYRMQQSPRVSDHAPSVPEPVH